MNQELLDALNRWNSVMDRMEAWLLFQEICQMLQVILPGFVCPFSDRQPSELPPTMEEMGVWFALWGQLPIVLGTPEDHG